MPRPSLRTRSKKRKVRSLPGGATGTLFKDEVSAQLSCSICGRKLAGVANSRKSMRLNQSRKRVWRPYGGQVCHNCLKTALRSAVRTV